MADSSSDASVTRWILPLADGDPVAAQQIFDRYYGKLSALAQGKLSKLPPHVADHEGAVNSALKSFFSAAQAGKFLNLHDRDALFRLLATLTLRKVSKQYRRHYGAKRAGARKQHDLDTLALEGREVGPEDWAILRHECERLMEQLGDETLRQVAMGMMKGLTNRDIAHRLDIHLRSVQRKVNLILGILSEEAEKH